MTRTGMNRTPRRDPSSRLLAREVGYVRKPHAGRLRVALAFPNTYYVGMSKPGLPDGLPSVQTASTMSRASVCSCPGGVSCRGAEPTGFAGHLGVRHTRQRVRRAGVFGVVRMGLHECRQPPSPGRAAPVRRRAGPPLPARRDRRRRDVREPRAAGAVCRHRGRRRGRSARPRPRDAHRRRDGPAELLEILSRERGFYVPSLVNVRYGTDGTIAAFEPAPGSGASVPVRKAALPSSAGGDPPSTMVFTPDTEFGSRLLVEVVRGCANLCRFCWAGYNYLPVRAFRPTGSWPSPERRAPTPAGSGSSRLRSATTRRSSACCRSCSRWATRSARPRCASTI